jgi:hypothetical protein
MLALYMKKIIPLSDMFKRRKDSTGHDRKYLPEAREIGRRVDEMLEAAQGDEIEEAYDQILADLTLEERQRRFAELFSQIPPERRFDLLLSHFNDHQLQEGLASERERLIREYTENNVINRLAEQAKIERRVDLSQVPEGMAMILRFYEEGELEFCDSPSELVEGGGSRRDLWLKTLGNETFMVIEDNSTWFSNNLLRPELEPYTTIALGGSDHTRGGNILDSYAYFGCTLGVGMNDSVAHLRVAYATHEVPLVLGELQLNGIELMGTALDN